MTQIKAFSYVRFSTPEQAKGSSLERQMGRAREYAATHNLDLDETLTFRDEGISAHKGRNFAVGRLAAFVAACDEGRVPPGSYLLVENLDRLSRQTPIDAVQQLQEILRRGVTVVTLLDGEVFPPNALEDFGKLLKAVVVMQRAYEESDVKSDRIGKSWAAKRQQAAENGKPMTSMAPGWLALRNGAYVIVPDRAETVQRIFTLTLDGIGKGRIAKMLNTEGAPTFGRGTSWHPSTVQKILDNEATIGTYQPHVIQHDEDLSRRRVPKGDPIPTYFPPIIDAATFYQARVMRQERRLPRGPSGVRLSNLFTGIATCAHCASPMHYDNKGDGYTRLICSAAKRGAVNHAPNSWLYRLVERFALLALHSSLDLASVLPRDASDTLTAQLKEIEGEALAAREAAARAGHAVERMLDLIETSDLPDYRARMESRSKERADAEATAERLEGTANAIRVRIAEEARDRKATEGTLQEWASISEGTNAEEAFAIRARLQQLLRRSIAHMELRRGHDGDPTYGDVYVILKSGQSVSMWLDDNDGGEADMRVHFTRARYVPDEDWKPRTTKDGPLDYEKMTLPEWWPRN